MQDIAFPYSIPSSEHKPSPLAGTFHAVRDHVQTISDRFTNALSQLRQENVNTRHDEYETTSDLADIVKLLRRPDVTSHTVFRGSEAHLSFQDALHAPLDVHINTRSGTVSMAYGHRRLRAITDERGTTNFFHKRETKLPDGRIRREDVSLHYAGIAAIYGALSHKIGQLPQARQRYREITQAVAQAAKVYTYTWRERYNQSAPSPALMTRTIMQSFTPSRPRPDLRTLLPSWGTIYTMNVPVPTPQVIQVRPAPQPSSPRAISRIQQGDAWRSRLSMTDRQLDTICSPQAISLADQLGANALWWTREKTQSALVSIPATTPVTIHPKSITPSAQHKVVPYREVSTISREDFNRRLSFAADTLRYAFADTKTQTGNIWYFTRPRDITLAGTKQMELCSLAADKETITPHFRLTLGRDSLRLDTILSNGHVDAVVFAPGNPIRIVGPSLDRARRIIGEEVSYKNRDMGDIITILTQLLSNGRTQSGTFFAKDLAVSQRMQQILQLYGLPDYVDKGVRTSAIKRLIPEWIV